MDETIGRRLATLAADARSGASELVWQAIAILRDAIDEGAEVVEVARAVGLAQPSMASIWNAALAAVADAGDAGRRRAAGRSQPSETGRLDRFEQRCRRAGAAMTRVAVETLAPSGGRGLHVVTWSFSGSVLACLRALAGRAGLGGRAAVPARGPLRVSCAEGRPMFEGRRLASALAADGIPVQDFSDAALAASLEGDEPSGRLVLVGADAVTPEWLVNKVGTGMLLAAAARAGVPTFAAATRAKFVDVRVARLLAIDERDAAEVWDGAPAGVAVRNPYFERVPIDLVSGVITDAGPLTGGMIAEACRAASADVSDEEIASLAPGRPLPGP